MKFEDKQTQILLNNYVFKIIPMLNPDGVARGYWRFDTLGLNLNRYYIQPTEEEHPTIWAVKNAVLDSSNRLKMYVDFHAHCTKKGFFIFGNTLQDQEF
jgi:murein tripeptide amidase MpaA